MASVAPIGFALGCASGFLTRSSADPAQFGVVEGFGVGERGGVAHLATDGSVTFVLEGTGESRRLVAGDQQVIEPDVPHHVEPDPAARFSIDFYR